MKNQFCSLGVGGIRSFDLVCPLRIETFWTYKLRGKASNEYIDFNTEAIGGYKRRPLANDIYVWLIVKDSKGQQKTFYEIIEMQTKFPNNHKYNYKISSKPEGIQVYDVDKLIDFLSQKNLLFAFEKA